jgi:hypothetical protein
MRRAFNKINKNYCLVIILAVVLVLLPTHPVKACNLFLNSLTECIAEGVAYFVYLILVVVGNGIAALSGILQKVINLPVYPSGGIAVIDESWKIMRNFANMFFIVALIMMAFATIFDVLPGAAKYNARALFGKFLLTALLINFSLVLGVMVIQGTQVFSNTFLASIGDMSSRLGQSLNPSKLIDTSGLAAATAGKVEASIFGSLIAMIFALVLAVTFLFSLLTAVIFAFIRIPILWALLVVSPIAWIMNIFPAGEGTFKKWWSTFVGWNMFLPIFLFFLYFGLFFLSKQDTVMDAIAKQVKDQNLGEGIPFTFQMVFMYIMAGIFLIGGTIVAMKASMFSGTGVVQVAGWSRGIVASRLGLTAAGRAAKGRYEEYKENQEGTVQRQAALFRTQFGRFTGGRTDAQDRQLAADVGKNKDKFAGNTDAQLTAQMSKGRKDERLAAAEILNQRGLLSSTQLQQTYALYGANTLAGKQFARNLNYDKMTPTERADWLVKVPDIETIKKILQAMADKGDDYIKNENNLNRALDLFKLEGDQRDLLKKIEKHELEIATKISMEKGFVKERGTDGEMKDIREIYGDPAEALDKAMRQAVSRMNPDALLEATRTLTKDDRMISIAKGALNMQKIEAMMAKGTEQQLNAWKKADDRFDSEKIKAEKERLAKELAEATGKATGEAILRGQRMGNRAPTTQSPTQQGTNTNPNNVVDLRPGEKRSPGGIILTPGAQAEMEREKRNNL